MTDRDRPPYLGEIPRDRRGNWPIYLLALGLLASLVGGWLIYANTVAAWSQRYGQPAPQAATIASRHEAAEREFRIDQLRQARQAAQAEAWQRRQEQLKRGELRCINGTLFRKLSNGWENVPGEHC